MAARAGRRYRNAGVEDGEDRAAQRPRRAWTVAVLPWARTGRGHGGCGGHDRALKGSERDRHGSPRSGGRRVRALSERGRFVGSLHQPPQAMPAVRAARQRVAVAQRAGEAAPRREHLAQSRAVWWWMSRKVGMRRRLTHARPRRTSGNPLLLPLSPQRSRSRPTSSASRHPSGHAELREHLAQVALDRLLGQEQLRGDLAVGRARAPPARRSRARDR